MDTHLKFTYSRAYLKNYRCTVMHLISEEARSSQFTDTYACPCTSAPRKDFILHASKDWHVAVHIDVISRHFDDILKFAATGCQDEPEIVPRCQKLLLRVFDN